MKHIKIKCGCVAQSSHNKVDIISFCKDHGEPDLSNQKVKRKSKCIYGGAEVFSENSLPYFVNRPDEDYDEYYCGCYGWD